MKLPTESTKRLAGLSGEFHALAVQKDSIEDKMDRVERDAVDIVEKALQDKIYKSVHPDGNGRHVYGRVSRYYATENIEHNALVIYVYLRTCLATGKHPRRGSRLIKYRLDAFLPAFDEYAIHL